MTDYALSILNGFAGKYYFLDWFMIFITNTGIFILLALLFFTKNKKVILKGIVAIISALLIDFIINNLYFVPRPKEGIFLVPLRTDSSFPSAHTLVSFSIAITIFLHDKKMGIIAIVLASLVAISRLFLSMHYLIDIFGGIMLAIIITLIIKYIPFSFIYRKI